MKVIHKHRSGEQEPRERESDLMFIEDRPMAILEWIDIGGVRTPLFICPLEREKLHPASPGKTKTFYYDDVTLDPRDRQT